MHIYKSLYQFCGSYSIRVSGSPRDLRTILKTRAPKKLFVRGLSRPAQGPGMCCSFLEAQYQNLPLLVISAYRCLFSRSSNTIALQDGDKCTLMLENIVYMKKAYFRSMWAFFTISVCFFSLGRLFAISAIEALIIMIIIITWYLKLLIQIRARYRHHMCKMWKKEPKGTFLLVKLFINCAISDWKNDGW